MTMFVKFEDQGTAPDDPHARDRWINPDHISMIRPYGKSTLIRHAGGDLTVSMPIDDVLSRLQGWEGARP